jgi:predicted NAD-dependent protein-ADP-ribosyltransferase YbiA (DUF1768 family)
MDEKINGVCTRGTKGTRGIKRVRTKVSIQREFECKLEEKWGMDVQKSVMRTGLRYKFSEGDLRERLLCTGDDRLEEIGRFRTEIWTNKGDNILGNLLMEVREELKKEELKKREVKKEEEEEGKEECKEEEECN